MFNRGDQVVQRGSRAAVGTVVGGPETHAGEAYYRVNFNGRVENVVGEDLEAFVGEQDIQSLLHAGTFGDHVAFARRLTMSKLRRPLRDAVYSYRASRTDFHAYQFKPLLKFLASERRRLLIADEVGLGKTIEAGYVLQEQRARFGIQRVLVVCPAVLRIKWQNEMWQRFGEEFEVLDRANFLTKALLRDGQSERGLPRLQGVVSLQSLRANTVIDAVEERGAPIDLLIVDEAHHCRNSETKQHRVVRALAENSEAVILLTATPIHLGDENLFNLLRLLLPEEFDRFDVFQERLRTNRWVIETETTLRRGGPDWKERAERLLLNVETSAHGRRLMISSAYRDALELLRHPDELTKAELLDLQEHLTQLNVLAPVMTRTRKREVHPDAAKREARVVRVDMTPEEQAVYARLSAYCFDKYTRFHGDFAARFALITLQRQLASSLQATMEHYEAVANSAGLTDEIDEDLGDNGEEEEDDGDRRWILTEDPEFGELVVSCRKLLGKRDEKLVKLKEILARPEKVVVFSYFKRSLRYLERALLAAGLQCVRIDGDVPANALDPNSDERQQRIERFRDEHDTRILLSSEVGSEGLDFQFCHVVVNWDLPWNPMVVEQRIGRLDRLGQKSEKILVFSFSCPGTIEDLILDRLYRRIGVFERTIGILEPILGQEIRKLTEQLLDAKLSEHDRLLLIDQKAQALAQRVRDEERLEAESANLVGHDEFFSESIDRIRRLGRFVIGEELRIFLGQFLAVEFPTCALAPADADDDDRAPTVYRMRVNESLRGFVRAAMPRNDPTLLRFLERSAKGRLELTFDNTVAMRNPQLELLTSAHPLVRAVAKRYDDDPTLVHPVTAVQVASNAVPAAVYFFLWASVEETGMRKGRSLWAVTVSADGESVSDADASEALLHHMVLRGDRWEDFDAPPEEMSRGLFDRAQTILVQRYSNYRQEVKKRNAARVQQRLGSLEASYRAIRAERERRLLESRIRGRERAIPLFEAQLRKLESDFEERCRQVEASKDVSVSWTVEGAGYVLVVEEPLSR
jgi:superfamily II DNA or RNA helicase